MARPRRAFGPLFYATVVVSLGLLGGYGGWVVWQSAARAWETRGLVRQLGDPSSQVRWRASGQLAQIGTDAVPAVVRALKDPDARVRLMACKTLPSLDPDAESAVPGLVDLLRDPEPKVRRAAVLDLGFIYHASFVAENGFGHWSREIVRALRTSLHDNDDRVRRVSAEALIYCGANAHSALAELTDALSDKSGDVRLAAARTLLQVDDRSRENVITALRELVWDLAIPLKNTPRGKVLAELSILEPGTRAKAAPKLVTWLSAHDPAHCVEAVSLFKSLGPDARPVTAELERLVPSADSMTRACAGMALVWVDATARERLLPGLLVAAKDASLGVQVRVPLFDTLRELAPDLEVELGMVVCDTIQQASSDQRLVAIELLQHLVQSEQLTALPALRELADHPDARVAEAARRAVALIVPTTAGTSTALK